MAENNDMTFLVVIIIGVVIGLYSWFIKNQNELTILYYNLLDKLWNLFLIIVYILIIVIISMFIFLKSRDRYRENKRDKEFEIKFLNYLDSIETFENINELKESNKSLYEKHIDIIKKIKDKLVAKEKIQKEQEEILYKKEIGKQHLEMFWSILPAFRLGASQSD